MGETNAQYTDPSIYKISYRISFWNGKDNELLAWFELRELGSTPKMINVNAATFTLPRTDHYYLKDGYDLYPLFVIEKTVYGEDHDRK